MPDRIKKERSRILTELAMKIGEENNKNHTGKEYRVLVTKRGKKDTFLSRTDSYRPVILKGVEPGKFYHVRIVDFTFNYLRGKVVEK
jgi:tRNA A37 methylthiotransferase MiaB